MTDYNKKNHNHYVMSLMSLYFSHFTEVSDYVKKVENPKYNKKDRFDYKNRFDYKLYSHVASVSNGLLTYMYNEANEWFRYYTYRLKYETKDWRLKRYKRGLKKRFPKDIIEKIVDFI